MFARLLFMLSSVLVVVSGPFNPTYAESLSQASELLPVVSAHDAPVYALAFSPDGMVLASAGADQSVAIWNTRTWQLVRRLEGEFVIIRALAFNTDGSVLAAGTDEGTVQLWKTATWAKPKTIFAHKEDVRALTFGRDGVLVTAGRDDKPQAKTRLKRLQNTLSLDRTDDVIKVWGTSKGSLSYTLPKATSRVTSLRLSSSGQFLVSGSEDGEITIVSMKTWKTAKRLKFQTGTLETLNFDMSGTRLVGSGYRQGLTRKYRRITNVWATSDWALVTALENQTLPIRTVDYNPRGNQLATGNRDGTVTVLSLNLDSAKTLGKTRKLEFDKPINVVRFSPDGRTLVFGNADGTINVLENLLSVPVPASSVIPLKPIPIPKPIIFVTPLKYIPVPFVTSSFNDSSGSVVLGIFIIVGLIAFIWFCSKFFTLPDDIKDKSSDYKPPPNKPNCEPSPANQGYVYLLKSGPYYKIGKSKDFNKRIKAIKLQLPFETEQVYVVKTNDMTQLENKWHRRFRTKRTNGEWFLLSDADVREFKRQ